MKVAVIGNGHVGKTVFRELQMFREIHELVLVGRNAAACRAEAEDYMDTIPVRFDMVGNIDGGGYELAQDADILVYCAGPSITEGQAEDRRLILDANISTMKEVFTEIDRYAPNAIVVVISNPLDVITTAIQKFTGRPAGHVIGTGTLLDTARMIKITSWTLNVSPQNVRGFVLGEHGATSVAILSSMQVMNMPFNEYITECCDGIVPLTGEVLTDEMRDEGFKIFRGKGYTSAGVAACAARIVFDIINNQNEILPVSTVLHGEYGVDGFAMSVPCQIGRDGVVGIKKLTMTEEEAAALAESAAAIGKVCAAANL